MERGESLRRQWMVLYPLRIQRICLPILEAGGKLAEVEGEAVRPSEALPLRRETIRRHSLLHLTPNHPATDRTGHGAGSRIGFGMNKMSVAKVTLAEWPISRV